MPTISLQQYRILHRVGEQQVRYHQVFPPIRVWGTVGFIVAMWTVDLAGWKSNNMQLIFSSVSALFLGLYAFSIPFL